MPSADPRRELGLTTPATPYDELVRQVAQLIRRVEELERRPTQSAVVRSAVDGRLLQITYTPSTNRLAITEPDGSVVGVTLS